MSLLLRWMRLLADPTRLRVLLLLDREELSVAELQELLGKAQSQISTNLSQLKQANLVEDRRTGKNTFYRLKRGMKSEGKQLSQLLTLVREAARDIPEADQDRETLKLILSKRRDRIRGYFDELAGRFGRQYLPGRSWQALAEALLELIPAIVIADLGAGEGTLSQLLARRARRVIAIDSSERMVDFGSKLARKHGLKNVEYRTGDLEALPISDRDVDLAFFSQSLHHAQHPLRAVQEAWRILKDGGRIVILDLARHQFDQARELYADVWLGFSELELQRFLKTSGFRNVRTSIVHREPDPPHFETLLAIGEKADPRHPTRRR